MDRFQLIADLYASGLSAPVIARRLGVSRAYPYWVLERLGVKRRPRGTPSGLATIKQRDKVLGLRRKGLSLAAIGEKCGGVSRQRIHTIIKEASRPREGGVAA